MKLDIKNKTINNNKYHVFDGIINGVTIDNIYEISKIETAFYDILVFITKDRIEHHILINDLNRIKATFYDENWNQISDDEINIENDILKQINEIENKL